jgi:hypothetical protein
MYFNLKEIDIVVFAIVGVNKKQDCKELIYKHNIFKSWSIPDSNRWPLQCDCSALPTELIPPLKVKITNITVMKFLNKK